MQNREELRQKKARLDLKNDMPQEGEKVTCRSGENKFSFRTKI
jgi:hypothetical protein